MNLPCLMVHILAGAAGGNLACARFETCKMGVVPDSLLGVLGGCLGGQLCWRLFGGDVLESELQLFLICVGGGLLGGALLAGTAGRIKIAMRTRQR